MKRVVIVLATLLLVGCAPKASEKPVAHVDTCDKLPLAATAASGKAALPDITIECLEGKQEVQLAHLRGPMLIAVWASWCGPCKREMPIMQQFSDSFGTSVPVLGYALLDDGVQAIMGSYNWGVTLPSVEDPNGDYRADIGVTAPPTTLFIDADGQIVYRNIGEIIELSQLKDLVREKLGVSL